MVLMHPKCTSNMRKEHFDESYKIKAVQEYLGTSHSHPPLSSLFLLAKAMHHCPLD